MCNHALRWFILVLAAWVPASEALAGDTDDRYYMIVFAAEGEPNLPRLAHTFATFIKVKNSKPGQKTRQPLEVHTISWLPANLDVRLLAPPEKGTNLSLKATLKFVKSENDTVSAWGPFEIRKDLYDRALAQIKRLDSGKIAYKALDGRLRTEGAVNCFHAVSDAVGEPLLDTGTAYGVPASEMVLQRLAKWIVHPRQVHRDLVQRLGLQNAGITFRAETFGVAPKEPKKK